MAVLTDFDDSTGQKAGVGRLSWPVFLLTLVAVTSSSLSALSLYHLMALRVEVEGLKSEACRRREEGQKATQGSQTKNINSQDYVTQLDSRDTFTLTRRRRQSHETSVSQSCLQMLANNSRRTFSKDFEEEIHTGIPWLTGLKRGSSLDTEGDCMVVREGGYYFVYSQVFYKDKTFAMGHVVIRRKSTVVGDEPQSVILFRCVQNMSEQDSFNTCFTGGIVKLEVMDQLELLVPRESALLSLDGEDTFMGAFKLA